jgi:hypothetical protein
MSALKDRKKDQVLKDKLTKFVDDILLNETEGHKEGSEIADEIIDIFSSCSPYCEECGKRIDHRTGLEKDNVLTPLCSVCQAKRMIRYLKKSSE